MSGRNPWPIGLVVVISFFALVLFGFVAFTTTQRVDLVSDDYYAEELAHQDEIDRRSRAAAPDRQPTWAIEGDDLVVTFPAAGRPEAGTLTLYRPSDARLDAEHELVVDAGGTARLAIGDLAAGGWRLQLRWTVGGEEHSFEDRLFLD